MNQLNESIIRQAFDVIKHIEEAGGEAYIVGGAVRDFLSGRSVKDVDIATTEPPGRIQQIFEKVIPVGIEHGTVIVRYQSESFEITTYRMEEGYEDYRHPDEVSFVKDIRIDLSRRDFTINAMAMDRQGTIIDPYHGQQAIKQKKIEAVGLANTRFQEDPLRMMRAIRFTSQLDFTIEYKTKKAIQDNAELLTHIAVERTAIEIEKMFAGMGYTNGIELLIETGIVHYIPLKASVKSLVKHIPAARLKSFTEIISYYVDLDPDCSVTDWIQHWKLSNKVKREATYITAAVKDFKDHHAITAWNLYLLPENLYCSFQAVLQAKGWDSGKIESSMNMVDQSLPIRSRQELAFQAKDLLSLFDSPTKGHWISEWLERIEYAVVESQIPNDYEKIKEWVGQWNPPEGN